MDSRKGIITMTVFLVLLGVIMWPRPGQMEGMIPSGLSSASNTGSITDEHERDE